MTGRAYGLSALVLCVVACQQPTEVLLEITTDADCTDVRDTSITSGVLVEIEGRPATTVTTRCDPQTHRIGSLMVIPRREDDAQFAIRVVTGVLKDAEACVADNYQGGCIVARRALAFVPNERLVLPIEMQIACRDVPCGATETCRDGRCASAMIDDPRVCTTPGGCDAGMDASEPDASDGALDVDASDGALDVDASDGAWDVDASDGAWDVDASDGAVDVDASDGAVDPFGGVTGCLVGDLEHPTVQSALDDDACPTVLVPSGTWNERLNVARDVTLLGADTATTIVDAEQLGVTLTVQSGAVVTARRLTLTGGLGNDVGGGVHSEGDLTLAETAVIDNVVRAQQGCGGGIAVTAGDLTLTEGTRVAGNRLEPDVTLGMSDARGGGICAIGLGTVTVGDGVVIENNTIDGSVVTGAVGARGGGIYIAMSRTLESIGTGLALRNNLIATHNNWPNSTGTDLAQGAGIYCVDSAAHLGAGDAIVGNVIEQSGAQRYCGAGGGGVSLLRCGGASFRDANIADNRIESTCADGGFAYGGGVQLVASSAVFDGARINDNRALLDALGVTGDSVRVAKGGGIAVSGSTLHLSAATVAGNQVTCHGIDAFTQGAGAGIAVLGYNGDGNSNVLVERSTIGPNNVATAESVGNRALANGAGIFADLSDVSATLELDVINSTITSNTVTATGGLSEVVGGGVYLSVSNDATGLRARLYNDTIVLNDASGSIGGGVAFELWGASTGLVELVHSIVANNIGLGNDADTGCSGGAKVTTDHANVVGELSTNCMPAQPMGTYYISLGIDYTPRPLSDNGGATFTHPIEATDLPADIGRAQGCVDPSGADLTVDQRGVARSGACDLGSFAL